MPMLPFLAWIFTVCLVVIMTFIIVSICVYILDKVTEVEDPSTFLFTMAMIFNFCVLVAFVGVMAKIKHPIYHFFLG